MVRWNFSKLTATGTPCRFQIHIGVKMKRDEFPAEMFDKDEVSLVCVSELYESPFAGYRPWTHKNDSVFYF